MTHPRLSMPGSTAFLRVLGLGGLLAAALPCGFAGLTYLNGNIHQVEADTLYRSGQLDAGTLKAFVAEKGIRTILNLRGAHPEAEWYSQEAAVAEAAGIDYRSVAISARSVPSMEKLTEIADTLKHAPRPILVHCEGGSDRSGLASALFELTVKGESEGQAAKQLSIAYGHFPWFGSRTGAMDRAFSQFAHYWTTERRELVVWDE